MGAAKAALIAGLALALASTPARAETRSNPEGGRCTGVTASGGRFATCFDPGNRLVLKLSTDGVGAGLQLRHIMHFEDEPDLVWKLEHRMLDGAWGGFW